jgi:hypothetical protein
MNMNFIITKKELEMYGPPPSGECDFGTNYTTLENVTGACPFEVSHAKVIISDESSVLRYNAVVWMTGDKDTTMLCFPNQTVIYKMTPYEENVTKVNFDGDGFYYIINGTDTVADDVENLVSPGFFYARDGIVDATVDTITSAWNYTNATGPEFLDLCDLMAVLWVGPPSPSEEDDNDVVEPPATDSSSSSGKGFTNPPSAAHKSAHWQIAMAVQALVLFTSSQ